MKANKELYILGIDTSCDETSVAIVKNTSVLSNIVSSQIELHRKYGGVVPMIAKREHQERIGFVIEEAFKIASKNHGKIIAWDDIDAIAVTYGPGLAIALEVGLAKAKELCVLHGTKFIAVNHMEGHMWSSIGLNSKGNGKTKLEDVKFPMLGVLISGGHTELVLINDFGKYKIIGETLDDAMGEAFDKVARMLGLGYPGGAVLSEIAEKGDDKKYKLPIPLEKDPSLNFSYSGLKTAVFYLIKKMTQEGRELNKNEIQDIAASFEYAAIEELLIKIKKALKIHKVNRILVGGGVSSNAKVRSKIRKLAIEFGVETSFPGAKLLFMDNGAMIGIAGYLKALRGEYSDMNIDRDPKLDL
jgi:N6-L-threonylcarbamoyladenine synthase